MRGFSTIEIVVALFVMTMTLGAVASASLGLPAIVRDAVRKSTALETTRTRLQAIEHAYVPQATSTSEQVDQLEDAAFARLTETQVWATARASTTSISLSTIIARATPPSACDPFTSGDWTRPIRMNSYQLRSDLAPSVPGATYSISAITATPHLLTVSVGSTTNVSDPTLFIFSLNSSSTPILMDLFDEASTSRTGGSAIVASGSYLFSGNGFGSASASTCSDQKSCAQVNVYSIASGRATRVASISLATSTPPYAITGGGATTPVKALAYYDGLLYLGLQKTARGSEFNIIDMHDPLHPRWIGGYPISRTVNAITVRGNYAYVSTDDPVRELMIFNIGDAAHPSLTNVWDAPGSATFGYGAGSTVHGNIIRFGRSYSAKNPEFEVLEQSSNGTLSQVQSLDNGTTRDPESVMGMVTQDRLTFVLLTHRLDVIDTHDSGAIKVIGTYALPNSSRAAGLACRNNQIYLARNVLDGSGVIDILQGS